MPYIYLLAAVFATAGLAVVGMIFNRRIDNKPGFGNIYNLIGACGNCLTWVIIFCANPEVDWRVLPYALAYGLGYGLFWVGLTGALQTGSPALSSFVKQIAFIFVAVWGFFFWGSEPNVLVLSGIALIVISLFLCLVPIGKNGQKESKKLSGKWLFYLLLVLCSNAGCAIVQRTQQRAFDGQYGSLMMVISTVVAIIFCALMCIKDDKKEWKSVMKKNWYLPVLAGSSSAMFNLFIILLVPTAVSPSLIYPTVAVGGLMLTTLSSILISKERLRLLQWIGLSIGAVALILLNL